MNSIGTLPVAAESLVVVHDPRSGRIVHYHAVTTFKGGVHPDRKTQEADARRHYAADRSDAIPKLAFLHTSPDALLPGNTYRVDVKKRRLVGLKLKRA